MSTYSTFKLFLAPDARIRKDEAGRCQNLQSRTGMHISGQSMRQQKLFSEEETFEADNCQDKRKLEPREEEDEIEIAITKLQNKKDINSGSDTFVKSVEKDLKNDLCTANINPAHGEAIKESVEEMADFLVIDRTSSDQSNDLRDPDEQLDLTESGPKVRHIA